LAGGGAPLLIHVTSCREVLVWREADPATGEPDERRNSNTRSRGSGTRAVGSRGRTMPQEAGGRVDPAPQLANAIVGMKEAVVPGPRSERAANRRGILDDLTCSSVGWEGAGANPETRRTLLADGKGRTWFRKYRLRLFQRRSGATVMGGGGGEDGGARERCLTRITARIVFERRGHARSSCSTPVGLDVADTLAGGGRSQRDRRGRATSSSGATLPWPVRRRAVRRGPRRAVRGTCSRLASWGLVKGRPIGTTRPRARPFSSYAGLPDEILQGRGLQRHSGTQRDARSYYGRGASRRLVAPCYGGQEEQG